ncbi:hypothetical protein DPEC_G00227180 [Dallia pectoralis]|uniref:Uncharacterized protein n=1 Tax=Dallia pectoralis TaxID=75939 RepID=A0ACC2G192_DALPE|nr:hypothetical protein DPEC_G00227180 [Dallia pectoralis]
MTRPRSGFMCSPDPISCVPPRPGDKLHWTLCESELLHRKCWPRASPDKQTFPQKCSGSIITALIRRDILRSSFPSPGLTGSRGNTACLSTTLMTDGPGPDRGLHNHLFSLRGVERLLEIRGTSGPATQRSHINRHTSARRFSAVRRSRTCGRIIQLSGKQLLLPETKVPQGGGGARCSQGPLATGGTGQRQERPRHRERNEALSGETSGARCHGGGFWVPITRGALRLYTLPPTPPTADLGSARPSIAQRFLHAGDRVRVRACETGAVTVGAVCCEITFSPLRPVVKAQSALQHNQILCWRKEDFYYIMAARQRGALSPPQPPNGLPRPVPVAAAHQLARSSNLPPDPQTATAVTLNSSQAEEATAPSRGKSRGRRAIPGWRLSHGHAAAVKTRSELLGEVPVLNRPPAATIRKQH